jgi:hypothetical protein
MIGEADNFSALEAVFPPNLGHLGESREKLARWVAPSLSAPSDSEKSPAELPLGQFFNEDSGDGGQGLAHERGLLRMGFGSPNSRKIPTQINWVITDSTTFISRRPCAVKGRGLLSPRVAATGDASGRSHPHIFMVSA